ncbi:hypothetical protein QYM36_009577 [Artemia franciscana]|uniref:Uncharacterized protein n=1 Tax=Artemia franciscana TaxID=6661 RepID=A0AA88HKV0_ARTSF|nr:hypothetical protein QYM36_009577 [Artemia franciscana]
MALKLAAMTPWDATRTENWHLHMASMEYLEEGNFGFVSKLFSFKHHKYQESVIEKLGDTSSYSIPFKKSAEEVSVLEVDPVKIEVVSVGYLLELLNKEMKQNTILHFSNKRSLIKMLRIYINSISDYSYS